MATSKFGNLGKRAASGAVFVLFTMVCVWFNEFSFLFAFGLFMLGALHEFYSLNGIKGSPFYILGLTGGLALFLFNGFAMLHFVEMKYMLFMLLWLIFSIITATFSGAKKPFADLGTMFLGIVYAAFPFLALQYVGIEYGTGNYNFFPVMLFLILVWANDSFAYLTGKFFGKNPLAKNISPGKTWEGSVGGFIGSLLLVLGATQLFTDQNPVDMFVIWFAASVLAVIGDLSESRIKRTFHVKNSGNFMPGHGGFLDRFDSLLLSAPFLMVYFLLIKA